MKKAGFLLLIAFLFTSNIKGQTVDSIKVEQAGDFIKIRYKILNSTPDQVFKVKVLCSMDEGMNYEIRSITGDVGEMVAGGKPEYWVVWDVLKDVGELKSAEFIVRAELIKNLSEASKGKDIQWAKKRFHLMLAGNYPGPKLGLQIGYMGSWGLSAAFLSGKMVIRKDWRDESFWPRPKVSDIGLDLTKRIVNKKIFQMHLMAGPSFSKDLMYDKNAGTTYTEKCIGFNCGFILDIKAFTLAIGQTVFFIHGNDSDNHVLHAVSEAQYFTASFGIKF